MPTYTLIASSTVASPTNMVTFSSIPSTYTDLVLRLSVRSTTGTAPAYFLFNTDTFTSTGYNFTALIGNGTTATSQVVGNFGAGLYYQNVNTQTANTFSSVEIYIPNYALNTIRPSSVFPVVENNSTTATIRAIAQSHTVAQAINRLNLFPDAGNNFDVGSSFYLYGIANS